MLWLICQKEFACIKKYIPLVLSLFSTEPAAKRAKPETPKDKRSEVLNAMQSKLQDIKDLKKEELQVRREEMDIRRQELEIQRLTLQAMLQKNNQKWIKKIIAQMNLSLCCVVWTGIPLVLKIVLKLGSSDGMLLAAEELLCLTTIQTTVTVAKQCCHFI